MRGCPATANELINPSCHAHRRGQNERSRLHVDHSHRLRHVINVEQDGPAPPQSTINRSESLLAPRATWNADASRLKRLPQSTGARDRTVSLRRRVCTEENQPMRW